jgi:hypothetical protein
MPEEQLREALRASRWYVNHYVESQPGGAGVVGVRKLLADIDVALAAVPSDRRLSKQEAAWITRYAPPVNLDPTRMSEVINVLASDSAKWGTDWDQTLVICLDAISRLYDAGYSLLAPPGPRPEQPTEEERP